MGVPSALRTALPLTGSVLTGMMPWGWLSSSGICAAGSEEDGLLDTPLFAEDAKDGAPAFVVTMWLVTLTAMRPGMMTRKGKNIFGTAAMRGTLRAETSESAAMARWMTRKSVHQ